MLAKTMSSFVRYSCGAFIVLLSLLILAFKVQIALGLVPADFPLSATNVYAAGLVCLSALCVVSIIFDAAVARLLEQQGVKAGEAPRNPHLKNAAISSRQLLLGSSAGLLILVAHGIGLITNEHLHLLLGPFIS